MASIQTIIDNDLCVGCGACLYACHQAGQNNLAMEFHEKKGMYEPRVINENKCVDCGCIDVCPSYVMDYEDLSQYRFGSRSDSDIGHAAGIYLAQNVDKEVNLAASSGGLIKATLKFYLESGAVDAIIALKRIDGITYKPVLIDKSKEIDLLPGSIYHNVDFSDAIQLMQETKKTKLALVAIPCQLEGIFSYIRKYEPELSQKIAVTIGLLCGWTYTYHAIKALSQYEKIPHKELIDISYRGGGPVGKLKLETKNGKEIKINRRVNLKYQAAFDRSYNLPRCHYCVNHGNFLADLVVGDAWLPSTVTTKTGISLLIARTREVDGALQKMKEDGVIKLVPARKEDVVESQSRRVIYGDFSYAYADYVKSLSLFAPTLSGPNKAKTKPVSQSYLQKFHKGMTRKIQLQREGKYWTLFIRKYTRESGEFMMKYIKWFFVRVVKIKSLLGKRKEIPSDVMKIFS